MKLAGWISPRYPEPQHHSTVAEAGYIWHGDAYDDDLPYIQHFAGSRIVAIPLTMEVNDMPLYVRYGNAPSVFLDIFKDNLRRALESEKAALTSMSPPMRTCSVASPERGSTRPAPKSRRRTRTCGSVRVGRSPNM